MDNRKVKSTIQSSSVDSNKIYLYDEAKVELSDSVEPSTEEEENGTNIKGKKPKKNRNFLVMYALTLLSVAFILVLLSYFNTMRANRSQIENLKQQNERYTISAMTSIKELENENIELKEMTESLTLKIEAYQEQIDEFASDLSSLEESNRLLEEQYSGATEIIEELEEENASIAKIAVILDLYSDREYRRAAYEVSELDELEYNYIHELLGDPKHNGAFDSLIEQYYEIREKLESRGYLDNDRIESWKNENLVSKGDT